MQRIIRRFATEVSTFKQFYPWNGVTDLTSYTCIIKSSITKQNVCLYNKSFQCTCLELKTRHLKLTRRHTVNREEQMPQPLLTFGIQNRIYFLLCSPHCTVWDTWQPMHHLSYQYWSTPRLFPCVFSAISNAIHGGFIINIKH